MVAFVLVADGVAETVIEESVVEESVAEESAIKESEISVVFGVAAACDIKNLSRV